MPASSVYEYAIIRLVPSVLRGECLNVGVILYCRDHKFLDMRLHLQEDRYYSFLPFGKKESGWPDFQEISAYLQVWQQITSGSTQGGPIATLDQASRFRWLTAPRSTIIQPSPLHPGICTDPNATLDRLFKEYVL